MTVLLAEQSQWIQSSIDAMRVDDPGHWPSRVCKERLNALPLAGNSIYLWALRPDGSLVCFDHEAFGWHSEVEADPVVIYAVMLQGAQKYPELCSLIPEIPSDARRCDSCDGTGIVERDGRTVSCLGCNGLGWYKEGVW